MTHLARFGSAALLAAGLAVAAAAWPVVAVAAEQFHVVNVASPDVLNIRSGPSASQPIVGTAPPDAQGLEGIGRCARGWCPIRYGTIEGWVNARFIARDTGSPGAPESAPATAAPAGSARVLADGTMQRQLPGGTTLRLTPDGHDQRVLPDGKVVQMQYLQVQILDLPPLPPDYVKKWGDGVGDALSAILRNILTADEIPAYLQTEAGKSYSELIEWRLRSIQFLTGPAS